MTLGNVPRGPGGKPGKTSTFLKLEPQRKVSCDPRKLDIPLQKYEGYRLQYAYVVFICREVEGEWKPIDARVVKTYPTLNKLTNELQKKGLRVLLHTQPVKIPPSFWAKWRKAKSGKERLELSKGLTKDENIYILTSVVLDWDSPYEECEPVFLELVDRLGIKGYEHGRTKSGNFRAVIYLEPLRVEKENQPIRTFYLTAQGKGRNGHTHLENMKEIVAILNAYARRKGIKSDDSFKRVNHPVWYGEGFYSRVRKVRGETKLYDLYRKAKELQREEGLWEVNREFWGYKDKRKGGYREKTSGKVVVPSFVARIQAKQLSDLYRWQIAVRRLAEKHTHSRFTKVILPAISWAMDLGLFRVDVDSYLRELLPDKKDMDRELERAWKYARPQRFEWHGKGRKIDLKEKLIEFLENTEEGAPRQYLLSEVFGAQNWLLQIVERFAIREGLISIERKKLTEGPGRKSYIYTLTEKGKSFVESLKDNAQKLSLSLAVGFDMVRDKKSIYKTPPLIGEEQVSRRDTGLVEDGRTIEEENTPTSPPSLPSSSPLQSWEGENKESSGNSPPLLPLETGIEGRTEDTHEDLIEDWLGDLLTEGEEVEVDIEETLRTYVFSDRNEAISFLESLNGRFRIGDRVKVKVKAPFSTPDPPPVLYEFEKVVLPVYQGFRQVGERETWELRSIYWNTS